MKICFLYSGQGSQKVGMGKDLYEKFDVVKDFYDALAFSFDIKKYSFEKGEDVISQTRYTQPIMVAFQIAMTKLLASENIVPDVVGGLSIGEYPALYASGILSDVDAMIIADKRGVAMTNSTDTECKMMAIIGADESLVKNICEKISSKSKNKVEISNVNCPSQIVISGEKNAVDEAVVQLKQNGVRKIVELKVSSAFHTSYMQKASEDLEKIFENIKFNQPKIPVGLNIDGRVYTQYEYKEDDIKNIMVEQVKSTVYFEKELRNIINGGVDIFVEIGFSGVIKGFLKKIDKNLKVYEVNSVESFENFILELKEIYGK